jgi:hypothetical protein
MSNLKKSESNTIYCGEGLLAQIKDVYYYTQEDVERAAKIADKMLKATEAVVEGKITWLEYTKICEILLQ